MIPSGAAISGSAISSRPDWGVAFLVEAQVVAAVSTRLTVYAATVPFATGPTDTPPSTSFLSTLRQNFTCERSIEIGGQVGSVSVSLARVEVDNSESLYDDRYAYTVDGEEVVIKVGAAPAHNEAVVDYSSFYEVARFRARKKSLDEQTFAIEARDAGYLLDVPASPDVYEGTGNLEGGAEVKDKRKPAAYGWCPGVTAAELLPEELIYQVHGYGSVQDISAVYDTGVALDFDDDYATIDALREAAENLIPGEYATCVAYALFMLGGSPFGQITADVEGDNDGADGFVETTSRIVKKLVFDSTILTLADLADNTFDLLHIEEPSPVGYFIPVDSNETVQQVINALMDPIFGYCGFDRLGLLEVQLINPPSITPMAFYDETQVSALTREELPDNLYPPPQRVRMAWDVNWTVLTAVAGEEDDHARAAYLRSPYRTVSTPQADADSILRDYPSAADPEPIKGYFKLEADALAAAQRRLDFARGSKAAYRSTLPSHPFVHNLCETIQLTRGRFDMASGKRVFLIRVRDDIGAMSQEVAGIG